jgi:hypothetical protein
MRDCGSRFKRKNHKKFSQKDNKGMREIEEGYQETEILSDVSKIGKWVKRQRPTVLSAR